MKKLSKITESIWSDMQDRSAGITQRKEDDVNLMSMEDFCDYLNDNYICKNNHKIIYNETSKRIYTAILKKKQVSFSFSISYYENNTITMNDEVESLCPELCKMIKKKFKVVKDFVSSAYTQFIIFPPDSSKCTNRFFVNVIDFIIDNADENVLLLNKKKHINESIWSDMQDRSAGETVRQEDLITTNEDLRDKIWELYKEQGEGETLDVSSLTNCIKCDDFSYLFRGYVRIKQIIGLEDWDVSNVKDMGFMFQDCRNFNCDLSKWDVSSVEKMGFMFQDCRNFNCDLSKWDVSSVGDMYNMFQGCYKFNADLSKWDVSNVDYMGNIFGDCKSLKQIPSWYIN